MLLRKAVAVFRSRRPRYARYGLRYRRDDSRPDRGRWTDRQPPRDAPAPCTPRPRTTTRSAPLRSLYARHTSQSHRVKRHRMSAPLLFVRGVRWDVTREMARRGRLASRVRSTCVKKQGSGSECRACRGDGRRSNQGRELWLYTAQRGFNKSSPVQRGVLRSNA